MQWYNKAIVTYGTKIYISYKFAFTKQQIPRVLGASTNRTV